MLALPSRKLQRANTKPYRITDMQGSELGQHQLDEMVVFCQCNRSRNLVLYGLLGGGFTLAHDGRDHLGQRLPVA